MQSESMNLKEFVENFFKKINSNVSWKNDALIVSGVPKNFETFLGKSSPYKLVFEPKFVSDDSELISKGSFFLNSIANFLKSGAKNSLLKMNFPEIKPESEINSRFTFLNSQIKKITSKQTYDFLSRFTFSTVFQYMNEKENIIQTIYIKDGKILSSFNLGTTADGNKREFLVETNGKDYESAKEELKKTISDKSKSIAIELKTSLEKETKRIQEHYSAQIEELKHEYDSVRSHIEKLNLEKEKSKEIEKIEKKLEKLTIQKEKIEKENKIEELKKEMDFIISDEKSKLSLNINTSLLNAAIIYYPSFIYEVSLESIEGAKTIVKIPFDPLQKHIPPLLSEFDASPIYKVYLCAGGHVCKPNELAECIETGKRYCAKFMEKCSHCHKPVYKSNSSICSISGKRYAKSYVKKDSITNRDVYFQLLESCESCLGKTVKENLQKCPSCKRTVCKNCPKKSFVNGSLKLACKKCSP